MLTDFNVEKISPLLLENAANWWFDKFMGPQFKDNGATDYHKPSLMAGITGAMIAHKHPVDESQRSPFIEAFSKEVYDWFERSPNSWEIEFYCDYHPSNTLLRPMEVAAISEHRSPIKTGMWMGNLSSGYGVMVSAGYAAPHEFLWKLDGSKPVKRYKVRYTVVYPEIVETDYHRKREEYPSQLYTAYDKPHLDEFLQQCANGPNPENSFTSYYVLEDRWVERLVDEEWIRK